LGDFKVLRESRKDQAVLVGAGVTVHECLKAHEILLGEGIESAVIDLYCIKPFDAKRFIEFARKHGGFVVVSEDHYPQGGIGEMIASSVVNCGIAVKLLNVSAIPHSGESEQLLHVYGIDAQSIASEVVRLVKD
jgi:transketolase